MKERNHILKIALCYYEQVKSGDKTSELRYNDRDFQKGDTIQFKYYANEYDEKRDGWEEMQVSKESYLITHVLTYPHGLNEDYVVLSIKRI